MPQDRFNGVSTFESNEPAFSRSSRQPYSELFPTKEATFHDIMTLVERYLLTSWRQMVLRKHAEIIAKRWKYN